MPPPSREDANGGTFEGWSNWSLHASLEARGWSIESFSPAHLHKMPATDPKNFKARFQ